MLVKLNYRALNYGVLIYGALNYGALFLFTLFSLVGCQLSPTKGREVSAFDSSLLLKNASSKLQVDSQTVIVDVRSAFEFSLSHLPGAINFRWEDFADVTGPFKGHVTRDIASITRRLALSGIGPETRVLVVGKGRSGKGEEGRVAWSLLQLGVKNVQTATLGAFKLGFQLNETELRPRVSPWKAQVISFLEISKAGLFKIQKEEGRKTRWLDVRSEKEYLKEDPRRLGHELSQLEIINIPWDQFYNEEGRPDLTLRKRLRQMGWSWSDQIIVVSHHGIRSGAVAFALLTLGFTSTVHFSGGYQELFSSSSSL
ncbi:MAG: hypothetical protein K1X29_06140 [Bdellovibrionales bacterium]|nr:hypothetical protein [Bdellovibrionales bacterium]